MLDAACGIARWATGLMLLGCLHGPALADGFDVIPRPLLVQAAAAPDPVTITANTPIITPAGDIEAAAVAGYLASLTLRSEGVPLVPRAGSDPAAGPAIVLVRGASGPPEGYAVDIRRGRVTITARTQAGLFYGAVTVWQMMSGDLSPGPVSLPAVHVEDAPRFRWRGLLLDSARHYQSPAFIERMLDWMALHKLNVLQWHLTDDQGWRIQIDKYPRLTGVGAWRTDRDGLRYGGFYTPAQIRHLVAFAAARNITIVPEIEMPGHALAAVVAYPAIGFAGVSAAARSDWGAFPSIYNVDEPTFGFFEDVLTEVMALFPSQFIAIGGDEAVKDAWVASPVVQARMKALGIADETALQSYFTRRIGSFLNGHGRRLIGWDEILQGGDLPPDAAVLSWHGADGALAAAEAGHDVVMASAPTLYFDNRQSGLASEPPGRGLVVSLHDVYAYDPGRPPLSNTSAPLPTLAEQRHIIGVQANIWTEHIATEARVEAMALPRAAALAESGWTAAANRDWPDFVRRLPAQMARYKVLGLNADTGAVAVAATVEPVGPAAARVELSNQIGSTDIRYTTDGGDPATGSAYRQPFEIVLPARLRAAAFADHRLLSPVLDRKLDADSVRRRSSQELRLCTDRVSLNLESRAGAGGAAPRFLVDIMNPCWIYPAADLTGIIGVSASVGALPFNYQLGTDRQTIVLRPPATPAGELVVRQDGCDGPVLAVLPLAGAATDGKVTTLGAAIPPRSGVHDLCFMFTARQLDPIWAIDWFQLDRKLP